MQAGPSRIPEELIAPALQANKDHQYALKVYTERLEAELEHLDKLLASADVSDNEEEEISIPNCGGSIALPGATRPRGLFPDSMFLEENSPFFEDATRKQRYDDLTVVHPMQRQELDALAEAVRAENYRLYALQAQAQGLSAFLGMAEPPPEFINRNKEGIDWERVAQKVSSVNSTVERTARECEVRWLGELHPDFNDGPWTQPEILKVRQLVGSAREGEVDWVEVAQKLGTGRTPVDCMRHAIARKTHVWTSEADACLMRAVEVYGVDNWALVARTVSEDATPAQCQNRWQRTLDPSLRRGPWTAEEDEQLRRAVAVFGNAWIEVAQFVEGRTNEQCRERYQEYVNPTVAKGKWSAEEDEKLLEVVAREVSRLLDNGRTDNMAQSQPPTCNPHLRLFSRTHPWTRHRPSDLILHPESYTSRSSTSTPAPETAAQKPKPKPRAGNRKRTSTGSYLVYTRDGNVAAPLESGSSQDQSTPTASAEGVGFESSGRPSKRRRIAEGDHDASATQSPSPQPVGSAKATAPDNAEVDDATNATGDTDVTITPVEDEPVTRGRGRGRGRPRGRGRGGGGEGVVHQERLLSQPKTPRTTLRIPQTIHRPR
ncbi:uncharacterized protein BXZ73DRAFT_87524 [Epithele typhae]|uniref:uncharacterized protein n=1 Tax=Epithele typhae TaxID=378194 RepID=UPI00200835E1|nr:uncharacterized protein BXZ73DRAFT_87524 [Epithele typhae]KAH9943120.1 hypothetical protein BXZ73DRAFT_87524 [Epithele typhae]